MSCVPLPQTKVSLHSPSSMRHLTSMGQLSYVIWLTCHITCHCHVALVGHSSAQAVLAMFHTSHDSPIHYHNSCTYLILHFDALPARALGHLGDGPVN